MFYIVRLTDSSLCECVYVLTLKTEKQNMQQKHSIVLSRTLNRNHCIQRDSVQKKVYTCKRPLRKPYNWYQCRSKSLSCEVFCRLLLYSTDFCLFCFVPHLLVPFILNFNFLLCQFSWSHPTISLKCNDHSCLSYV